MNCMNLHETINCNRASTLTFRSDPCNLQLPSVKVAKCQGLHNFSCPLASFLLQSAGFLASNNAGNEVAKLFPNFPCLEEPLSRISKGAASRTLTKSSRVKERRGAIAMSLELRIGLAGMGSAFTTPRFRVTIFFRQDLYASRRVLRSLFSQRVFALI